MANPYYEAWKRMYGKMFPDIYQGYYQGSFPSGSALSPAVVPQSAQVTQSPMTNQPSSFTTQFNAPAGTQQAYSYGQSIGLQPVGFWQKGQGQKGSPGHPVYDPYWQYYNPKTNTYEQNKVTEVEEGNVGSGFPDYGPPPENYKYGSINYYNPNGIATGAYAPTGTAPTATNQPINSPATNQSNSGVCVNCKSPAQVAWEQTPVVAQYQNSINQRLSSGEITKKQATEMNNILAQRAAGAKPGSIVYEQNKRR